MTQPPARCIAADVKHLLYILPTLAALWIVDGTLSEDRYIGWERNSVRNSTDRWERHRRATVALFGSSTSKDWLPAQLAARTVGKTRRDVVDAHTNGCHQACTWATVRKMLRRERRYEFAFVGTNLFQLCELPHSKRVLQQQMQLPAADVPRAFGLYLHAEQPLRYMGRYIGMTLSGAYADTAPIQRWLAEDLFGKAKRGREHRWYRADRPSSETVLTCSYEDDAVAYKRAFSEALLDDMGQLADRVFLMMLPDRTLGLDTPENRERWRRHMALHREMADARPWVTLVDLVTDGVSDPKKFRDGFHLGREGIDDQQALFERRMRELGWPKAPKASPKPPKASQKPSKASPKPSPKPSKAPKASPKAPAGAGG